MKHIKCTPLPFCGKPRIERLMSKEHYNDVIIGVIAPQITSLTIVYSTVSFRRGSKKTSTLYITGFVRVIHRWPVNSPVFKINAWLWTLTVKIVLRSGKLSFFVIYKFWQNCPYFEDWFSAQMVSNAENVSIWWCHHEYTLDVWKFQSCFIWSNALMAEKFNKDDKHMVN